MKYTSMFRVEKIFRPYLGRCVVIERNKEKEGIFMQDTEDASLFVVMSAAEFRERKEQFVYHKEMIHSLGSIRYCKAELFKDCILGTIRIPQKNEQKNAQLSFGFYLTDR